MEKDRHEDTKGIEGHEESGSRSVGIRIPSPLSAEAELALHRTIGCAIAVHRELGPGFLESIYRKAMYLELDARGLAYERERPVRVRRPRRPAIRPILRKGDGANRDHTTDRCRRPAWARAPSAESDRERPDNKQRHDLPAVSAPAPQPGS